jgi:hypothetical protein
MSFQKGNILTAACYLCCHTSQVRFPRNRSTPLDILQMWLLCQRSARQPDGSAGEREEAKKKGSRSRECKGDQKQRHRDCNCTENCFAKHFSRPEATLAAGPSHQHPNLWTWEGRRAKPRTGPQCHIGKAVAYQDIMSSGCEDLCEDWDVLSDSLAPGPS